MLFPGLILSLSALPTAPATATPRPLQEPQEADEAVVDELRDVFDGAALALQHEDFATAERRLERASELLVLDLERDPKSLKNLRGITRLLGLCSRLTGERRSTGVELVREFLLAVPREVTEEPQGLDARAFIAASAGNLPAVAELQRKTLALYVERYPEGHPIVSLARANLAKTLWNLGSVGEAAELWDAVARARAADSGPEHEDTLEALASLAVAYQAMGDFRKAQQIGDRVLEIREGRLEESDDRLLQARTFVGMNLGMMGELDRARDLLEAVYRSYREKPATIATFRAASDLSALVLQMGDYEEAARLESEALAGYVEVLPTSHPEVLRSRSNLATTLQALGRAEEARRLQEEVLMALDAQREDGDPEVAAARNALGTTLVALGELEDARLLFRTAFDRLKEVLPSDHPHLRDLRRNLATTLGMQGLWAESIPHFEAVAGWYQAKLPAGNSLRTQALEELYEALRRAGGDAERVRRMLEAELGARQDG